LFMSKVLNSFWKSELWQKIFFNKYLVLSLNQISPLLFVKYRFFLHYGRFPNLHNPCTFDEKLLWLNFFWQHPLKTICGDKYTMRQYVEEHGLNHILTPLLGVYESVYDINFEKLPQKFVLKCTHGCGFNIVCRDKRNFDFEKAKRKLAAWMKLDLSKFAGELHYHYMKPRIIGEIFLEDLETELPVDYKVYCFGGRAHCTMVCCGREINNRAKYYIFYNLNWTRKLPYTRESLQADINIPKPAAYEEIIHSAELLSKPFPFVRMDFYSIKGKPILGEMTFTPSGSIDSDLTEIAQKTMGDLIILPKPVFY